MRRTGATMIHRALIDLVLAAVLLVGYYAACSAGRNDGRREAQHQQHVRTDAPIPMENEHGGEEE